MKAIVQDAYGSPDVLELRDIARPVAGDDEVLVRVRAASVHADVWHVLTGLPYVLRMMGSGLRRPGNPVPGTDLAGVVESVGRNVTRFQPGDEVFGETLRVSLWINGGAYAEYATAPEQGLALKPANVTFEQAAAVPTSALIALPALRRIQAGQRVLVNGAGGGMGAIAVQLARAFGAEVTGVDTTSKLDLIRSIGADHVIDYTVDDFTRRAERYDLIFDIPGNHSLAECRRALTPGGSYVLIGHDNYGDGMRRWAGQLPRMVGLMARSAFVSELRAMRPPVRDKRESMELLRQLLESGKLTPHIDRTYPLSEAAEAIRYLQQGRAKGKVVITVQHPDAASGSAPDPG
jgi:NADPH:quinone reductase-like Zn-dependent oxidoreductase